VSPFPTAFHLGPLTFHLYGFGLAIAAYVSYAYMRRRCERAGLSTEPFARFAGWLIVASLIGARAAHLATNWSYYHAHPARWLAVWQGGLASFGGIALALPVGLFLARRYWPSTSLARFADLVVPALVAGWALGRVLGPQFMYQGGGHLTHQWFGLRYAGQAGKRVPVPLIQGAEDGLLWLGLLWGERRGLARHAGLITGIAMTIWGLVRALDERLLLGQHSHSGSLGVQGAALILSLAGVVVLVRSLRAGEKTPPTVDSPS
jgi:phosphatidylglycerol---prolipoprotein diacylglyceryl transferase